MKVLLITTDTEDYLSDALLHGFRHILGENLIDFPKKHCMYKTFPTSQYLYGNGFSLYRTLDDIEVDRTRILDKVRNGHFNLIVFSDIYRQFGIFYQLLPFLNKKNAIICDGEDTTALFPYRSFYYKKIYYWCMVKPHKHFLYFKREWTDETTMKLWFKLLPSRFCAANLTPKNLRPISFAIPEEKIINIMPSKIKLFPKHIVDLEISEKVNGCKQYAFDKESEYYHDLQTSKFGITTQRGGWDCMRHYEIAANGTVLCFKNLDKKPKTCAPHGLNDDNCISYSNYNNLMDKINRLSEDEYVKLQEKSMQWVLKNTTVMKVKYLLDNL